MLETRRAIENACGESDVYMMSTGETLQCEEMGLKKFSDILKHPSRFDDKESSNMNYGALLKVRWGIIAALDFVLSLFLLTKYTRGFGKLFLSDESKHALDLYGASDKIFVKGGGFLHDYTKGLVGLYSVYYQTCQSRCRLQLLLYRPHSQIGPCPS